MDAVLKDRNAITGAKLQDNMLDWGRKKHKMLFPIFSCFCADKNVKVKKE
jgi:hypothetical protein